MLLIDGASGEGGGQILRTALSLSLATGTPFRMVRIRARRPKPGLARQHLTAVRAAAEVGDARVEGAAPGSSELTFAPATVRAGELGFSTDGAGSTTLVLQTVLPPLLVADGPSRLRLEGGTHNPFAPPFDFVEKAYAPIVRRLGPGLALALRRPGFYPRGGGLIEVEIEPVDSLAPLDLTERGRVHAVRAKAIVSALPRHIGERELATAAGLLGIDERALDLVEVERPVGPGNALLVEVASEHVSEVFTGFGRRGVPAERVAELACREALAYVDADVPVGLHLADQLLLPLCLAGRGEYRTLPPSQHTKTNIEVIQHFLDVAIEVEPEPDGNVRIRVA